MTEARYVATLLCDPSFPALADRHLINAAAALERAQPPQWLDQGIAADIEFAPPREAIALRELTEAVRAAISDTQIDIVIQPSEGRRKKLIFLEMDKVLLGQNTTDEIFAVLRSEMPYREIKTKMAEETLAFSDGLREISSMLNGRPTECLSQVLSRRMMMTPGAKVLVETMRANGSEAALATFGFSRFAGPVAEKAGIKEATANRLLLDGGRIVGLAEPVVDPVGKAAFFDALCARLAIRPSESLVALNDLADIPLARTPAFSIAFRSIDAVSAQCSGLIARGDLSAFLYIQGYRREDFMTDARRPLDASDWKRKYGAYEKAHERTRM
jgi:phosphoserine phosphatase